MREMDAADQENNDQLTGEQEFNRGFILPSLIIQLRKILEQYPDDVQILKELIQNAEDAGATVVKFLFDNRMHGQDPSKLFSPGLAKYQGPALYAYNDAEFNEDDWRGIRMLLQSVKQNDPHKVGYFGMGFKSVFHITDLPSVISGDRIGIIDPLRQFFDGATGCHAWNLSHDGPEIYRSSRQQLDPYIGVFGCETSNFEFGQHYAGTLFRFPLRAGSSEISDTVYGADRLRNLLNGFETDAHLNMIFLRSVETVEVYERSRTDDAPVLRFRVSLSDRCLDEVRRKRKEFLTKTVRPVSNANGPMASAERAPLLDRPATVAYPVEIEATKYAMDENGCRQDAVTSYARYLVLNYHCGGPLSATFRKLHRECELRLLPCVGTAMSLDDQTSADDTPSNLLPFSDGGRVFCFLPLADDGSNGTGFPVHVNGSFALESNRKHLKWPTSSSYTAPSTSTVALRKPVDEHLDRRLLWNQCLLSEALPYAYAGMLAEAIRLHNQQLQATTDDGCSGSWCSSASTVYRAIPDFSRVDRRWESVLPVLFSELFKQASVFAPAPSGGGSWIEPRLAVFDTLANSANESDVADIVVAVLREAGVKVTDAPAHVQLAIRRSCRFNPTEITPTVVSAAVRTVQHRSSGCIRTKTEPLKIDWDSKLRLLRYFLRRSRCDLLDGLELLPLANGGFEVFCHNPRKSNRPIYVAPTTEVYAMLIIPGVTSGGGLEDDFLEMDIDKDIRKMLLDAINKGFTQLTLVDGPLFRQLLPRALPKVWSTHQQTSSDAQSLPSVQWLPGSDRGQPPVGWLESVWRYLATNSSDELSPVDRLPLVPARSASATNTSPGSASTTRRHQTVSMPTFGQASNNKIGKASSSQTLAAIELVPLYCPTAAACIVRRSDGGLSLGQEMESIVVKLGIRLVDPLPDYVRAHPLVERNYVFTASYVGVLRAVERQASVEGRRKLTDRVAEKLTSSERRRLRELFAKISEHELEACHKEMLLHLPLFETVEMGGGGRRYNTPSSASSNFACVADVPHAAPIDRTSGSSGSLGFPVSKRLLDISASDSQTLARLLGVRCLEPAELLVDVVFSDVQSGFHDAVGIRKVATFIFRNYHRLSETEPRFRESLRKLAIVERRAASTHSGSSTGSGNAVMVTASSLYDPDDDLLRRLFSYDDRWYPAQVYCDTSTLSVLREIGLKTAADLDPSDLFQTALRIAELTAEGRVTPDRIGEKSAALADCLQKFPDRLDMTVTLNGRIVKLAAALSDVAWVRRATSRPSTFYPSGLAWFEAGGSGSYSRSSTGSQFHRPLDIVAKRHALAVGSTMPVLAIESVSDVVEAAFGWNNPLRLTAVVQHLANVVSSYTGRDKPLYQNIVRSIYGELIRHTTSTTTTTTTTTDTVTDDVNVADENKHDSSENTELHQRVEPDINRLSNVLRAIADFRLVSWVWHGDGFAPPDRVVVSAPTFADLRPYLYGLPSELTDFQSALLAPAGVRPTGRLSDVLMAIKTKYDEIAVASRTKSITGAIRSSASKSASSTASSSSASGGSDVRRDLHTCISVLNELKSQLAMGHCEAGDMETLRQQLCLPVHTDDRASLKLVPLTECTYCDEEWLRQGYTMSDFVVMVGELSGGDDHISLVHANVPTSTSEALGVPSLMSRMLATEQPLDFGFGQADSLTGRLKALLDDYSDGLAVPKELIQNADDAGATEVRFLYDERDNQDARTCLLDEGMKECQGPALWVYNDAVFTDEDFDNITRLGGGGTKLTRTDQIGRFGLGFNVVYNLTDVPSFISQHSIVIFDPHGGRYLGRCIRDRSRPGVRIDLRRHRRSLNRFGNQFRPWDGVFGCDLMRGSETAGDDKTNRKSANIGPVSKSGSPKSPKADTFSGTLFRLPLRTAAQAASSEICNRPYTDNEVKSLMRMIVSAADSLLLFTQNVVRVGIYHIPKRSTNPARDTIPIFVAEKRLCRVIRELRPKIELPPTAASASEDRRQLIANSSLLRASTMTLNLLRGKGGDGHSSDGTCVESPNSSMVIRIEASLTGKASAPLLDLTPSAAAEANLVQHWLVCNVMGKSDSLKLALSEDNLIPTAGVAVRLELQNERYQPIPLHESNSTSPAGMAFSFMPLPIRTGLPVHVNGCFMLTSSRKHLCLPNEDDKFDPRPAWNRAIFNDPVCFAYTQALNDIASIHSAGTTVNTFELWPNPKHLSFSGEDNFIRHFYRSVMFSEDDSDNEARSKTQCRVFTDGRTWATAAETYFLDGQYAASIEGQTAIQVFRKFAQPTDKSVVCALPSWVEDTVKEAEAFQIIEENYFTVKRFFEEVFLPNVDAIESTVRAELILDWLKRRDPLLNDIFARSCTIPCSPDGEKLKRPGELVDPTSSLASLYLESDGLFPAKSFASTEVLGLLRDLGMKYKTDDVSWVEIIARAESIAHLPDVAAKRRLIAGLLSAMNEKLQEIEGSPDSSTELEIHRSQLCSAEFIPIIQKPVNFPFTWFENGGSPLAKPTDIYHSHFRDLVCCIRPIFDASIFKNAIEDDSNSHLLKFLKIEKNQKIPSIDEVLDQLASLVGGVLDFGIPTQFDEFDEFQRMLHRICDFLQNHCKNDARTAKEIGRRLENVPFVLIAERLVSSEKVVFEFPHDCAPYLNQLPDVYRHRFHDLMTAAGVRNQFEASDFVHALRELREKFGPDSELDPSSLGIALRLASLLNNRMTETGINMIDLVADAGSIFIPDSTGVLRSTTELCYNEPDCQWMLPSAEDSDETLALLTEDDAVQSTALKFSHPLIPYEMSRQLGVSTRRHDVLQRHSRGIGFGQREQLTNRLRRILASYPCDRELLNEMVQNADDAGASTIHFIKDPRQHSSERVFDPKWSSLQGPALCIYSDRPFTEKDLDAIQRLGEGRKGTDPNATGQYGVGFNCVYHLTDVPSFLTGGPDPGGTLCIFDPHAKFAPGATRDEPGRRFTDIPRLKRIFTDVFSGYLEDKGFDVANGTMFRLPLRDESMAKESELSDQIQNLETVDRLFDRFRPEMFDCLLFLNSVNSIHLSQIDVKTGQLTNVYSVTTSQSPADQMARVEFVKQVKSAAEGLSTGRLRPSEVPNAEVTYEIRLTDSYGNFETWLVVQRLGFDSTMSPVPSSIDESFRRGEFMLMPRGGAAALIDASDARASGRARRVSCFLPLPLQLDLPVSINGHFALDHESRRNLWYDDVCGPKTAWNRTLLQQIIAPAYLSLLNMAAKKLDPSSIPDGAVSKTAIYDVERFCRLFPKIPNGCIDYWKLLIQSFYKILAASDFRLFPVVRSNAKDSVTVNGVNRQLNAVALNIEWLPVKGSSAGPIFLDSFSDLLPLNSSTQSSSGSRPGTNVRRSAAESVGCKTSNTLSLKQVLLASGFNLVSFPVELHETLREADIGIRHVSPAEVIDFLASSGCRAADNLPADVSVTVFSNVATVTLLLDYCMHESEYFYSHIDGLPLLVTQDGYLRRFSSSQAVFLSPFQSLCPGLESRFVHTSLYDAIVANSSPQTSCGAFRALEVQSFADLLPYILTSKVYGPPNIRVVRAIEENGPPTGTWLPRLWTFLKQEFERCLRGRSEATSSMHDRKLAFDVVRSLADWCLLPVKVRTARNDSTADDIEKLLVPIGDAPIVFDFSTSGVISQSVCRCLSLLGIAELDCDAVDGGVNRSRQQHQMAPPSSALGSAAVADATDAVLPRNSAFARLLVSTLEHPDAVICAVNGTTAVANLSREHSFCLLRYFTDSLPQWRDDPDLVQALRSAKLFVTISNEIVSIANTSDVYVIKDDSIPSRCNLNYWKQKANVIFLQHHHALVSLYDFLGVKPLSVYSIYADFVFPNFSSLEPDSQIAYLEFLRDSFFPRASLEDRKEIVGFLRCLEFVPPHSGSNPDEDGARKLCRASSFYDPHHPLLKLVLKTADDQNRFPILPGEPFNDLIWLDFLRIAGLRTEVDMDLLIGFAMFIADDVAENGPSPNACDKSRAVVTHLFRSKDLLLSTPNALETIAQIRFVASSQGSAILHSIHPAFCRKDATTDAATAAAAAAAAAAADTTPSTSKVQQLTFIAFSEGIPERYEPLCWTSAHLLPDWANPHRLAEHDPSNSAYWREVAARLQVSDRPSIELVVKHVINLCNPTASSARTTAAPTTASGSTFRATTHPEELQAFLLADTMKKIYRYLQAAVVENGELIVATESSNDAETVTGIVGRLSNVPCVVTNHGRTFLRPFQIVVTFYTEDQLAPYLHRLPSELCEFRELFVRLGATLYASPAQFAFVLANVHARTAGERLHPNELRLVYRTVKGLFLSLTRLAADQQTADVSMAQVEKLYLPTDDGLLLNSSSLVYRDNSSLNDRIGGCTKLHLLANLSEYGVHATSSIQLLPERLRPTALSTVVSEVLDKCCAEMTSVSPVAERLRCQVSSRSFGLGILRLIRHEQLQQKGSSSAVPSSPGPVRRCTSICSLETLETFRRRLERVEVFCVDHVRTYLTDRATGLSISNSESELDWFVDKRVSKGQEHATDEEDHRWAIYIGKVSSGSKDLEVFVADAVNEIVDGQLGSSVHFVSQILSCAPHAISRTLDRLRVRPDHGTLRPQAGSNTGNEDRRRGGPALPTPGSFIPIEEHHLLREDFVEFESGEYVGYELDSNETSTTTENVETTIVYAIVIKPISSEDVDDVTSNVTGYRSQNNGEKSSSSTSRRRQRFSKRYLLNVGDDRQPIVVPTTSIYKFHRVDALLSSVSSSQTDAAPMSPRAQSIENYLASNGRSSVQLDAPVSRREKAPVQCSHANSTQLIAAANGRSKHAPQNGYHVPPKQTTNLVNGRNATQPKSDEMQHRNGVVGTSVENDFDESRMSSTLAEITDALTEAWQLPLAERRKVIRRLLLRWHPDKNIGDEQLATSVTQHIHAEIERLETAASFPWNDDPNYGADPRNPFADSDSFRKNFAEAYRFFFEQMKERGREQRAQRERYRDHYTREFPGASSGGASSRSWFESSSSTASATSDSSADGSFVPPPTFASCNPQPAQARRFLRQAREDIRSADHDLQADEPSYEWVCFKARQAAKKALKAAVLFIDASSPTSSNDIVLIAAAVDDPELGRLSRDLDRKVGDAERKLFSPDPLDYSVIPHDEHDIDSATEARRLAAAIIDRVGKLIESTTA